MLKFLLLFSSLLLLFSSCPVKKMLWEQVEIESAVPAKPYPSKAISVVCTGGAGNSIDKAEVIPTATVKLPLLLSVLLIVSFRLPTLSQQGRQPYSPFNYSNSPRVPIYLKLGRLILYS